LIKENFDIEKREADLQAQHQSILKELRKTKQEASSNSIVVANAVELTQVSHLHSTTRKANLSLLTRGLPVQVAADIFKVAKSTISKSRKVLTSEEEVEWKEDVERTES